MFLRKWLLLTVCIMTFFFAPSSGFCQEKMRLPCEVMESSDSFKSSSAKLNGVRYLLLHHANSADRETLSKWLKDHSETEVTLSLRGMNIKGFSAVLLTALAEGCWSTQQM